MTNMRDKIIGIIEEYVGSDFNGEIWYADDAADAILADLFNTVMREKIAGIIDECQHFCNEDILPYYCTDKILAAFTGATSK